MLYNLGIYHLFINARYRYIMSLLKLEIEITENRI